MALNGPARRLTQAFTLVEILIVVVILGILAAIVIPSFAKSAQESTVTATYTDLQKLRRHIEVYRIRHASALPDVTEGSGTWGQIVGPDHLQGPPVNSYVGGPGARTIAFGAAPDTAYPASPDYGWIYDPYTGQVWAAGFSAEDQPLPR